jgi:thioredoxin reductase (NADPH)
LSCGQDVDGYFVAIGHIPNTKPFVGKLDLDPAGAGCMAAIEAERFLEAQGHEPRII